ncbi:MAG: sulfite exporter TauE/SafE family protein [Proteobacteria bacterium]|nr:sulfite exporter TauE/SafE family protein [Pseudomonadota bacterium]
MWNSETLVAVGLAFLIAGFVKGVIGLGLPTVSLALLTVTIGLKSGMALMIVPSLVTNIWQGLSGGGLGIILKRLWPFLGATCVGIWFGVKGLAAFDASVLTALLGVLLCIYAGLNLKRVRRPDIGRNAPWLGPLAGAATGVLTGLTGSFVVPGVIYLQALSMPRNTMIQAMGVAFTVSTVALAVGLGDQRLITQDLGMLSAASVMPALVGMVIGQRVRGWMSETVFLRVFFAALAALGVYIVVRSLIAYGAS